MLSLTLMFNRVGIMSNQLSNVDSIDDELVCPIGLQEWYILITSAFAFKLLVVTARYAMFKKHGQESITALLFDLILVNAVITAVFIQGNQMYFSNVNYCSYASEPLTKLSYHVFCSLLILGYLQFIWCIILSCYLPLTAFIIYELVQHRLNRGQADANSLIGGLIQIPLPIPEILSSLNRTKYGRQGHSELATECKICYMDFQENEEVTPLICDERHLYHTKCIEAWIRTGQNSCPYCRKQIANIN